MKFGPRPSDRLSTSSSKEVEKFEDKINHSKRLTFNLVKHHAFFITTKNCVR